ncbi:Protein kinase-like domain protein [Niveomyces insectorum RCEF 264]|uniref:Protein kinase-like domain protein n=1 Tax=Niveomyces insectorum RCEF 264 TaxID=1081102 RepID=A0A167WB36_9HYPO|nr:Protein kinase-like domain protein [Niveomyces insectorum RCEF 264]
MAEVARAPDAATNTAISTDKAVTTAKAALSYGIDWNVGRHELVSGMLGLGASGIVMPIPGSTRCVKAVMPWHTGFLRDLQCRHLRREIEVYRHLHTVGVVGAADPSTNTRHPRFCQMFAASDDGRDNVSLTLEYLPNWTVDEYLRGYSHHQSLGSKKGTFTRRRHDTIPMRQRARWALEAADGLAQLHAHGVIHADLKPLNMALDAGLGLRIIDLAGCALLAQNKPPLCLESTRFFLPRSMKAADNYSVTTDLFALGSSLYQIVTGYQPYDDLSDDEVEARYSRHEFPDLAPPAPTVALFEDDTTRVDDVGGVGIGGVRASTGRLLFADIMQACWLCEVPSAAAVLEALLREVRSEFSDDDLRFIQEASGIPLDVEGQSETVTH